MLLFLSFFIFVAMLYTANILFYLLSLLVVCCLLIAFLSSLNLLSGLVSLMLLLVYAGAMIILIGYICAVTPNLIFTPHFNLLKPLALVCVSFFFSFSFLITPSYKQSVIFLSDYFYNFQGLYIFFVVVFILFLTLLIVTSQFLLPSGPFRSLS